LQDIELMVGDELLDKEKLLSLFEAIEPELYKYPAIDPDSFSRAVHKIIGK